MGKVVGVGGPGPPLRADRRDDAHPRCRAGGEVDRPAHPGVAHVIFHDPIDPAEAHYNLARAYNMEHQTEKAKDELFAALEAAPGYKPALKLYLELNGPEKETPEAPVKK